MKKLFFVILILAAMSANASDLIVGTTFGNDVIELTTLDCRVSEPVSKYWGKEFTFGVAAGIKDFNQNIDFRKYNLGLGANVSAGDAKLAGGYVISYIDGTGENTAYPGFYGSLDFNLTGGKSPALTSL